MRSACEPLWCRCDCPSDLRDCPGCCVCCYREDWCSSRCLQCCLWKDDCESSFLLDDFNSQRHLRTSRLFSLSMIKAVPLVPQAREPSPLPLPLQLLKLVVRPVKPVVKLVVKLAPRLATSRLSLVPSGVSLHPLSFPLAVDDSR